MVVIREFAHDPNVYTNPEEFNPDRFLKNSGNKPEMDPHQYIFGFGRRFFFRRDVRSLTKSKSTRI